MTSVVEQPDTTKLRSAAGETRWPTWRQVLDLCDAVDQLRAQAALSYSGAHKRLMRTKGRAGDQTCARCPKPAETWAYDGNDDAEMTSPEGYAYSGDVDHYEALCRSCHSWADGPTHCPNGHEYNAENTHVRPESGYRQCRVCGRERERLRAELAKTKVDLDAARAERDEVKGLLDDKSRRDDTALMAYKREKYRAEAAEARVVELDLFVGIMRDRVATVLDMHVRTIDPRDCDSCELFWPCPTVQALLP